MAADKKGAREKNPMADAANWNDRVLTELEAPHKWNEAWGQLFQSEVPHEYKERIQYLENELKGLPPVKPNPKYGGSEPFPTFAETNNRRKITLRTICDLFKAEIAGKQITEQGIEKVFDSCWENIDDTVVEINQMLTRKKS